MHRLRIPGTLLALGIAFLLLPHAARAATVTNAATTTSTSNVASYASGSFAPAVNDLLVVFVTSSGTTNVGSMTDSQGMGFTLATSTPKNASADTMYMFVSNVLATTTNSMTVTFALTSGTATGAAIDVMRIAGMTRTGSSAIVQTMTKANQASGGTPAATFSSAAQTGNPTVGAVGNSTSPATLTPPSSWTEQTDTGYSTPTTGQETISRNSGFTGTTITWGSTSASAFGVIIAELNTSAATAPTVSTDNAESFTPTSASLFGSISNTGGASITQSGFAYSTDSTLSSGVSTTTHGSLGGAGGFTDAISGLSATQTYYYRAYAINSSGTRYGSIRNFTTGNTTPKRQIRLFEGYKIKILSGGKLKVNQQ